MSGALKFAEDLWQSVLTPGITPSLITATHASFAALLVILVFMLVSTKSLHFVALLAIASGLWAAVTWFIREIQLLELEKKQKEEQEKEKEEPATATASGAEPAAKS